MSNQDEQPEPLRPVCVHCGDDPASFHFADMIAGGLQFVVVFCGNVDCRATIAVELVAQKKPQPDVIMPPSRIMIPS